MELKISEEEYRRLPILSYSALKTFIDSREEFYKLYVLGEKTEDIGNKTNPNLRMGSLVDTLLLSPEEAGDKFVITKSNIPVGQMLAFTLNLYKATLLSLDLEGKVTMSFGELVDVAYQVTKFDADGNTVAFKRKGSGVADITARFLTEGKNYYEDLRLSGDKVVITPEELDQASKLVRVLRGSKNSEFIFKESGINQIKLKGVIDGVEFKGMLDRIVINEETKTIDQYDLKTTWNVDQFDSNYLTYKYYIQNYVYTKLLEQNYPGYTINPMSFLVADKLTLGDPIVYRTGSKHLEQAYNGFTHNGVYFKGVGEAIAEFKRCVESRKWTEEVEYINRQGGERYIKLY